MTTATEVVPPPNPVPAARPDTVADLLYRLGDIPPDRIRMDPPPGRATFEDLVQVNEQRRGPICEWVENTLVEKAMGQRVVACGHHHRSVRRTSRPTMSNADRAGRVMKSAWHRPRSGRVIHFLESLAGAKPPPRSDKVPRWCLARG